MILAFPAVLFVGAILLVVAITVAWSPSGLRAKAAKVHGVRVA